MSPSSNWFALKKNLKGPRNPENDRPTKRRRVESTSESIPVKGMIAGVVPSNKITALKPRDSPADRDSVDLLRKMVEGKLDYPPAHLLPGKFLAIDCEMVGIAGDTKNSTPPNGRNRQDESSLARVSVVNYHGAIQLDVFVQQRERVTDWRTAFSGVRESDMRNAKPFSEVQKLVSDLIKDRILVGHAVHNDLKVLLLSHPHNMMRDTQVLAGRHGTLTTLNRQTAALSSESHTVKIRINRKPALRKLVSQELGIEIQAGEHSSVIDARATMAIYRLHRKIWDRSFVAATSACEPRHESNAVSTSHVTSMQKMSMSQKRSRNELETGSDDADGVVDGIRTQLKVPYEHRLKKKAYAGHGKGLSTGLSVVVKRRQGNREIKRAETGTRAGDSGWKDDNWWGSLS